MGTTDRTPGAAGDAKPLWQRLGWLALIWAGSVAALGAVAYVLRLWIAP
ncbi:DUF2474 domain-containing protein [Croceicoccus pelagius]|uniref:DUF2474 domain-containing protein n=1 Tax=Croceicoccus pelagius TaxID=1703341 RepID=A0A916YCD2_9SPHN|nr:DUF2474 domain-containing protein [Croceicoccus pelagius]GGD39528.1 hypothetical protein GCM10010989_12090 [Croceicoccus pelagius]